MGKSSLNKFLFVFFLGSLSLTAQKLPFTLCEKTLQDSFCEAESERKNERMKGNVGGEAERIHSQFGAMSFLGGGSRRENTEMLFHTAKSAEGCGAGSSTLDTKNAEEGGESAKGKSESRLQSAHGSLYGEGKIGAKEGEGAGEKRETLHVTSVFVSSNVGESVGKEAEGKRHFAQKSERSAVESVINPSMNEEESAKASEPQDEKEKNFYAKRRALETLSALYRGEQLDVAPFLSESLSLTREMEEAFAQKKRNIKEENVKFALCLDSLKVVFTAYLYGELDFESAALMKELEKSLHKLLRRSRPCAQVYVKYADYLYAKIPASSSLLFKIPVFYRKALEKDANNTEARVKMACFYCFAATAATGNFNSFIEENEWGIEELSPTDRLNAYISYSLYYMKKNDTKKGLSYLRKAKEVISGNILAKLLEENYKKGVLSL